MKKERDNREGERKIKCGTQDKMSDLAECVEKG